MERKDNESKDKLLYCPMHDSVPRKSSRGGWHRDHDDGGRKKEK